VEADDILAAGNLGADHIEIRLIDSEYPGDNPRLNFVLNDAAQAIRTLRAEGKSVFTHCLRVEQRTPVVAVAYSRLIGVSVDQARDDVLAALPTASGRGVLWETSGR